MPCAEGEGCGTNNRAPPPPHTHPPTYPAPKLFRSRLRLSALQGNSGRRRWNQKGVSAVRRQANRASKKSRTRGEREGRRQLSTSSSGPKAGPELHFSSFIWRGGKKESSDEKKGQRPGFVIRRLLQRYLCFCPFRLSSPLAFGLLDCCT